MGLRSPYVRKLVFEMSWPLRGEVAQVHGEERRVDPADGNPAPAKVVRAGRYSSVDENSLR
jgi:hypothetical protein